VTARAKKTGIVLFAHGSSVEEANRRVHELAQQVQERAPYGCVHAAFLEKSQPDLATAIDAAVGAGLNRIIIVPYLLSAGVHLHRDLPNLVAAARRKHGNVEIAVSKGIEGHPLIISIILDRVREFEG